MPTQKSVKGRLSAAPLAREVPAPRGHVRTRAKSGSALAFDKGMGNISRKAAKYLQLKTGRNPPNSANVGKPSRQAKKRASG
ncbi:MAG: hypothetical protein AB1540_07010 [Bdellovibrionota bacterium]